MKTARPFPLACLRRCASLALSALVAAPAVAKGTLVYCSEGSPEGFQPQFFTHRHDVRCGVGADVQPAGRIRDRHDEHRAGARRVVDGLAGRQDVHVQAAQGRQVPQQRELQADARLQRRRRAVLVVPDGRRQPSVPQIHRRPDVRVFRRHGHEEHRRQGREGRRLHGALFAEASRSAVPRRHGDGLRVDPVEGVLRDDDEEGNAERRRRLSDRHRPVRIRQLPEGRDDPLQGVRPLLEADGRRSTT